MVKLLKMLVLASAVLAILAQKDYSQLNYAVFHAHNKARADPRHFANLAQFEIDNKFVYKDGKPTKGVCLANDFQPKSSVCYFTLGTAEGAPAWQELVNDFTTKAYNLQPLKWSEGLSQACYDHSRDTGPKGMTGHYGSDKSSPHQRIMKYVKATMTGENLSYSDVDNGEQVILQLLIDDGVPSRGHRHNIMHADFTHLGVSCGCHNGYTEMCCLAYGRDVVENDSTKKAASAPQLNTCKAYSPSTPAESSTNFSVGPQSVIQDSSAGTYTPPPPRTIPTPPPASSTPSAPSGFNPCPTPEGFDPAKTKVNTVTVTNVSAFISAVA